MGGGSARRTLGDDTSAVNREGRCGSAAASAGYNSVPGWALDAEMVNAMLREDINDNLKTAMKAGDKRRISTLRLVNAAIKDRDIEARGAGRGALSDEELHPLLQKMIKQRQESASIYEQAGRQELATQEREEIAIIASYLPRQMSDAEMRQAIAGVVEQTGAAGLKDIGKVMAALKGAHAGRMDFAKASTVVKALLSG
jgi:uncharacterized protein